MAAGRLSHVCYVKTPRHPMEFNDHKVHGQTDTHTHNDKSWKTSLVQCSMCKDIVVKSFAIIIIHWSNCKVEELKVPYIDAPYHCVVASLISLSSKKKTTDRFMLLLFFGRNMWEATAAIDHPKFDAVSVYDYLNAVCAAILTFQKHNFGWYDGNILQYMVLKQWALQHFGSKASETFLLVLSRHCWHVAHFSIDVHPDMFIC